MNRVNCFLLAWLDENGTVKGISTCGESPWTMTRRFPSEAVIIYESHAETYTKARESCRIAYPSLMPWLSKRFPFTERT